MKTKNVVFFLFLTIIVTACNKETEEGVYQPQQKIEKIYCTSEDYPDIDRLSEVWHWNDEKLVQIDYYSLYEDVILTSHYFSYNDENRLTQISSAEGDFNLTYQDNQLSKIEYTMGTFSYATWDFEHKNDKITKMTLHTANQTNKSADAIQKICSPLNVLFPEMTCNNMYTAIRKYENSKSNIYFSCSFTYNKNDIVKEVWQSVENTTVIKKWEYTYEYDNKNNPFYGLFCEKTMNSNIQNCVQYYGFAVSEHNITHISGESATFSLLRFSYSYDNKYPVTKHFDYENGDGVQNLDGFLHIPYGDGESGAVLDGFRFEYK